jgi:protein-S-isoprenylcysteine O-methyltransferase Ste14
VYILMAIQWEEKDLVSAHGKAYEDYRRRVPMLIPRMFSKDGGRVPAHSPTTI